MSVHAPKDYIEVAADYLAQAASRQVEAEYRKRAGIGDGRGVAAAKRSVACAARKLWQEADGVPGGFAMAKASIAASSKEYRVYQGHSPAEVREIAELALLVAMGGG